MPPRFEDLDLDAQLDMPVTMKRELLRRPDTHRGADAVDLTDNPCTKYFRRVNPTTGRVAWSSIPGANCSVRALTPPTKPAAPRTPTARTPRAPAAPRPATGAVTVCGTASAFLSQISRWSAAQSGNPAFVDRFVSDWTRNLTGAFQLCPRDVDLVDREIDRLLRSFGGSRNAVPIQMKVPIELLANLMRLRTIRYTPRDATERARLLAGALVSPPGTGQSIKQTIGRTAPTARGTTPTTSRPAGIRLG